MIWTLRHPTGIVLFLFSITGLLGARVPLHGRNLPAGPVFTLGYFLT
jgi:hypothetical protein